MDESAERLATALAGRYTIQHVVGSGGMATVYSARDEKHDREVAVKVLLPELAGTIIADRFLQEINIVARLTHPLIVPLHDSGEADGFLFYVMPLLTGNTLRSVLRREIQLSVDRALNITNDVADALSCAHEAGVVHRDIKPENILFESGHAVVADFGIARAVDLAGGTDISQCGLALGTPVYMSPEQGSADVPIDERSDVYSLGCVAYEMLAGEPPFNGATAHAVFARKATEPSPSVCLLRDTVPKTVDAAIRKALAPVAADRFASVRDFAKALRTLDEKPEPPGFWIAVASVFTALVLAVAVVFIRQTSDTTGSSASAFRERVAVSPFVNRSGVSDLEGLGVMAADWITQGLQQTGIVDVVPTATALHAWRFVESETAVTRSAEPARTFASETGAEIVISGSFYSYGDTLQVQVQIVNGNTGELLGAPPRVAGLLTGRAEVVAQLRDRVMGFLAISFDERLSQAVGVERLPPSYDAYRLFSEGLGQYIQNRYPEAIASFHGSYLLDSTFVLPLLYESLSEANRGHFAKADSLLGIIVQYRDQLSDYHRGWLDYRRALLAGDRSAALHAIRSTASAAPGSKAVYNLAVEAWENGYVHDALNALQGLHADRGPMRGWFPYWDLLCSIHHVLGDRRKELDVARQARRAHPQRLWALVLEVRALARMGRVRELTAVLEDVEAFASDPAGFSPGSVLREAGEELRAHGNPAASDEMFARAVSWFSGRQSQVAAARPNRWEMALALYGLGQWQDARAIVLGLLHESPYDVRYQGFAGVLAARLQFDPEVQRALLWLEEVDEPYLFGLQFWYAARIMAVLREDDQSVAYLQTAFARGLPFQLWVDREIDFQTLREQREFSDLVQPKSSVR